MKPTKKALPYTSRLGYLVHYYSRNGAKFYRDEIGKRFRTIDGIVFEPFTK